jgi:hypothetical protein
MVEKTIYIVKSATKHGYQGLQLFHRIPDSKILEVVAKVKVTPKITSKIVTKHDKKITNESITNFIKKNFDEFVRKF